MTGPGRIWGSGIIVRLLTLRYLREKEHKSHVSITVACLQMNIVSFRQQMYFMMEDPYGKKDATNSSSLQEMIVVWGFWSAFPAARKGVCQEKAWRRDQINPRWIDLVSQGKLDGIRTPLCLIRKMKHTSSQIHELKDTCFGAPALWHNSATIYLALLQDRTACGWIMCSQGPGTESS